MKSILLIIMLMISACAFTPHRDAREYPVKIENTPEPKGIAIKVYTSTPLDNVVGKIKNGWGMETADISIPQKRTNVLQQALEAELKLTGYQVKDDSSNALLSRINQYEIEIAQEGGAVGYYSICDVNIYLKTKSGLFERNVVATDKVTSYWAVTAKDGVDSFYKVTQECAKSIVKLVEEKKL
ncbi:hypothetical protein [Bdellovibrio sp.]|uniref:hypothetical protein n=1 Tax=Bdellovibrio sp. TaxID=28201 RepID=UPI0039E53DE6